MSDRIANQLNALITARSAIHAGVGTEAVRDLAHAFGIVRPEAGTLRAIHAVLDQLEHPGKYKRDKDAREAHSAGERTFRKWKHNVNGLIDYVAAATELQPQDEVTLVAEVTAAFAERREAQVEKSFSVSGITTRAAPTKKSFRFPPETHPMRGAAVPEDAEKEQEVLEALGTLSIDSQAIVASEAADKRGADTAVTLLSGDLARLEGLASRADLNGIIVQLLRWSADAGRWAVQCKKSKECVAVRLLNLRPLVEEAAMSDSPVQVAAGGKLVWKSLQPHEALGLTRAEDYKREAHAAFKAGDFGVAVKLFEGALQFGDAADIRCGRALARLEAAPTSLVIWNYLIMAELDADMQYGQCSCVTTPRAGICLHGPESSLHRWHRGTETMPTKWRC